PKVIRVACTSCTDTFLPHLVVKVPCDHHYCGGCLEHLYTSCMTDETLFPPRCCHKDFPWELVRHILTQKTKSLFGQKRAELETKDRTYCHIPTCSAFIKPDTYVGRAAPCPKTHFHGCTCTFCKQAHHLGPCPRDATLEQLNATAEEKQWQRCFACHRMVELRSGCNHITCFCKTEFWYAILIRPLSIANTYVCGLRWKLCKCPTWDEVRLLERGEDAVVNGMAPRANPGQNRDEQVAQAVQHIRANHECTHAEIRITRQAGFDYQCQMCDETYRNWLHQCRQCWMTICGTCRYNRL
ncbi:hypothetical protein BAUCODRAFT_63170, partial [Baudoinia panamericana UAMH 10762]